MTQAGLVGKRILLKHMEDVFDPIPDGATGTVFRETQDTLSIRWDAPNDRRSLSIVKQIDTFEVIT
jgi:RNase P/RNase MRP subunit p29